MAFVADVSGLIADLTCKDVLKCQRARRVLVQLGEPAVEPLEQALHHKEHWVHWEAAKALAQIGSPRATSALIETLLNREFELRWLAAEGLISIGDPAVVPILEELIRKPQSVWLREGAHHVLLDIKAELADIVRPVLEAIAGQEPAVHVPIEAARAIQSLRQRAGGRGTGRASG